MLSRRSPSASHLNARSASVPSLVKVPMVLTRLATWPRQRMSSIKTVWREAPEGSTGSLPAIRGVKHMRLASAGSPPPTRPPRRTHPRIRTSSVTDGFAHLTASTRKWGTAATSSPCGRYCSSSR
jgi:hypothetical protein